MSELKHLLQFEMSLDDVIGYSCKLPEFCQNNSRHKDCPNMTCGNLSEVVYIKSYTFSLQGFRKKGYFYSNSKGWEKIENFSLEICSQMRKLENFRIQSSLQVNNKNLEELNRTRI